MYCLLSTFIMKPMTLKTKYLSIQIIQKINAEINKNKCVCFQFK